MQHIVERLLSGSKAMRRLIRRLRNMIDESIGVRQRYIVILDNFDSLLLQQECEVRDILVNLPAPTLEDAGALLLFEDMQRICNMQRQRRRRWGVHTHTQRQPHFSLLWHWKFWLVKLVPTSSYLKHTHTPPFLTTINNKKIMNIFTIVWRISLNVNK